MNKVGRYVVISELGRGAMGIVYKASDPTIDREVALKVISLNGTPGDGSSSPKDMFMREVRAAGRLAHPSIVTIHDAFDDQESKTSCIVMELVPGVTLEKILESGRKLSLEQVLFLVRQVAEGLDFAHRNQVVHRDLKPANILVTEDGRVKITDFGIAKVLAREGAARTVGVLGTPSYMSPEQVKGGSIDARTDIFSLGIILYTMLTGTKPFSGNTAAVMFKIVYEEPAPPSSSNPELAAAHDYVVKKCLAKDRNRRYSSARELLGDLDDLQFERQPRSQVAPPASAPGASPASTSPQVDRTMAMGIPTLLKGSAQQQPSPKPVAPPSSPAPAHPGATQPPKPAAVRPSAPMVPPSPDATTPLDRTVAMTIPGPKKAPPPQAVQGQAPQGRPPAPSPPAAAPRPRPVAQATASGASKAPASPPAVHRKPVAPNAQPARSVPPAPSPSSGPKTASPAAAAPNAGTQPLKGTTLPLPVPDLSALGPVNPQPAAAIAPTDSLPLTGQTVPQRMPDLSTLGPIVVPLKSPTPSVSSEPTQMNGTLPMRVPDFQPEPPAVPPVPAERAAAASVQPPPAEVISQQPVPEFATAPVASGAFTVAPPASPIDTHTAEVDSATASSVHARRSKFIPALIAGVALALLVGATWGLWRYHATQPAPSPSPTVAAQNPPVPSPPVPPFAPRSAETATSAAAPAQEAAARPATSAPVVVKKAPVPKPKAPIAQHPAAPAAPPAQPRVAAVIPAPRPAPAAPDPEAIAKAEAAKLTTVPRIVQVQCNYGLKEGTITFSSGGQTLIAEPLRGKRKKEGFLGIKGSYQGSFSRTITIPAGASELSIHVVSKDGATDLSKAIKMPPTGGFVPTLAVEVDNEHLSPNWRSSSAAN